MSTQQISNSFLVEIDGAPLRDDAVIDAIRVEDNLHLPDTFEIVLRDATGGAVAGAKVRIGSSVRIAVLADEPPHPVPLLDGEVTALEAEILGETTTAVIRGYDQSHRLFRGRTSAAYTDVTYADIAHRIAERNRLTPGTIHATSPVHPHVSQYNATDWDFLQSLALEVGFEVAVTNGELHFRRRGAATGAPGAVDLEQAKPLTIVAGQNVLHLRASVTAAEQVREVEVRGWDPMRKEALSATASTKTEAAKNALGAEKLAAVFPSPPLVSTDVPYATAREVDNAAAALADAVAGAAAHIDARVRGSALLRAGRAVSLSLLGEPFDGDYVLTTTSHTWDRIDGYVTSFAVTGRQDRSLLGLLAGATGASSGSSRSSRLDGVVPGLVDDVADPESLGRVRVRLPWLGPDFVTGWCRVLHAGAGAKRGWFVTPEVGDEVLVAFEQGDIRRPYVLGGLYSPVDPPVTGPDPLRDASTNAINNRVFTSRTGHQLVFVDTPDRGGITVQTAGGRFVLRLDEEGRRIEITSSGEITLKAETKVTVDATGDLTLTSGGTIAMDAAGELRLKGASVQIEGSGPVTVKGATIRLN